MPFSCKCYSQMWISVQESVAGIREKTHVLNHSFLLLCHLEWMWYKKYNTNYSARC